MKRKNCWEVKKCGRQLGGEKVDELGICPAAMPNEYDGTNKGNHGGRFCWAVAGTFCGGKPQGSFAQKFKSCIECKFFKQIQDEEGSNFSLTPNDVKKLQDK